MSKTYLFLSGKGGVGKSTTAVSVALALADRGVSCVLMDGDVGLRCADLMLDMQDRVVYDFMDLCEGTCSLDSALYQVPRGPGKLCLLAASQVLRASQVKPGKVVRVCSELRQRFSAVLIDGPAGIGRNLKVLLDAADECVVVSTMDDISVRDAEKSISVLREHGKERISLLLNRVVRDYVVRGLLNTPQAIAQSLDVPLIGIIPESPLVYRGMIQNKAAYDCGDRALKKAIDEAVSRMLGGSVPLNSPETSPLVRFFTRTGEQSR